jgi:uncharacterized membrane-anchored protein YjiN (DUF445 family)
MGKPRNRIGSYFLIGALAGFLLVSFQPWIPLSSLILLPGLSLKRLLASLFDAALVGALADWYAVTALFRDPLGLRLPHTNILYKNKDSIAEAVPRFLTGFVTDERIAGELARVDFAGKLEEALASGIFRDELHGLLRGRVSAWLAGYAAAEGPRTEALAKLVSELCVFAADNLDPAPAFSELLKWARREAFDERILEGIVEILRTEMGRNRAKLAAAITPIVKRNAGWKGLFIGRGTMEELIRGIEEELGVIRSDRRHELRLFVIQSIERYAENLAGGGGRETGDREQLREGMRAALLDEGFRAGLAGFVADLLSRLGLDLGSEESRFIGGLDRLEDGLVDQLRKDGALRARFNATLASLITRLIVDGRFVDGLSLYLSGLLKAADSREFVDRIEDSVWNDLQYIRVNGAVVGGLVGLVLAFASAFFPA